MPTVAPPAAVDESFRLNFVVEMPETRREGSLFRFNGRQCKYARIGFNEENPDEYVVYPDFGMSPANLIAGQGVALYAWHVFATLPVSSDLKRRVLESLNKARYIPRVQNKWFSKIRRNV